mmetsp:Transcript_46707/g.123983  ORF Transcript_46707/g.123983 Transcript_46707/m.123983 type:complete len:338 (+) Transcript_46707:459-1472(+)
MPMDVAAACKSPRAAKGRRDSIKNIGEGSGRHLELAQAVLDREAMLQAHVGDIALGQGVDADGQRTLGREDARDLALVLRRGLADERRVVDETVLGSVVLALQRAEQGLLGAENLNSRRRVLGQVHQAARMSNETRTDQLTNHGGQVGRDRAHSVLQVLVKLHSVLGELDNLIAERLDVGDIILADLRSHRDLDGLLELLLGRLVEARAEVPIGAVGPHAHDLDHLGVGNVLGHDLAHLREVPAVPLANSHGVGVELLVELVQQPDGLHDHGVDLVRRELELVPAEAVRKTQPHVLQVGLAGARKQALQVSADPTHDLEDLVVVDAGDAELLLDQLA